jgi:hypothetical protein
MVWIMMIWALTSGASITQVPKSIYVLQWMLAECEPAQ